MIKYVFSLLLAIPLACSNNSSDYSTKESYSTIAVAEEIDISAAPVVESVIASSSQKLIKTAFLRYETKDLDETYNALAGIISVHGGFIQDDSEQKNYNRLSRQLILRLPTNKFQSAVDAIGKTVDYFDTKTISSKDVTEEFIDLEARLKAKQALEQRYIELLDKAKNVKEILDIERELSKIREDIEAKQGHLKYLKDRVSLSAITIEFYKVTSETGVTQSYGSKMWNAIKSGFDGVSIFFLGLLYIWPLILIIVILIIVIKRRFFKTKKTSDN